MAQYSKQLEPWFDKTWRPGESEEDTGTPVSEDYKVPFQFSGKLNRVLIQLSDEKLSAEDEEQIRRARAAINMSQ